MNDSITGAWNKLNYGGGIRMAIGANQKDVLLMILLYGLKLSATGLAIGIVGAWWVAEQLSELLFNVTSQDVGVYLISLTIMLVVTIAASLFPSYQASMMNPNRALRAILARLFQAGPAEIGFKP